MHFADAKLFLQTVIKKSKNKLPIGQLFLLTDKILAYRKDGSPDTL